MIEKREIVKLYCERWCSEAGAVRDRYGIMHRHTKRNRLVSPRRMLWKLFWRIMVPAVPREVARFLQSRLGELSVSEARYEDLLSEADAAYPRYLTALRAGSGSDATHAS